MRITLQDIRFSFRQLKKAPGFSSAVILTFALTISFAAAIFAVLYAVLISPLPYNQPDRIVALQPRSSQGQTRLVSYPDYLDWRQKNASLSALATYNAIGSINFEGPQGPVALNLVNTSDNFFDVFGIHPLLGRTFTAGEEQPGRNDVVVLSYEVWQHQFGKRASVVGEMVKLDGHPFSVIGVMPAGFRFPITETDAVYAPLHPTAQQQHFRTNYWLMALGRLKTGVTPAAAQADMMRVLNDLSRTYPDSQDAKITVVDLPTFIVGDTRSSLRLLFYAVLALLAVGCVNVAGLLLIRGVKRDRELALRAALGAGKRRILTQIVTEALVYSVVGAGVGIVLAYGLLHVIGTLLATGLVRGGEITLNAQVVAISVLTASLIAVLACLAPAWRISESRLNSSLRTGGSAGTSRGQYRLRAAFVITQFALGLVLLVVSGLLLVTLVRLRNADLGFSSDHVLTAEVDLSPGRYAGRDVVADFYYPLLEKVASIPGVQSAGVIQMLPIQSWGWNQEVHLAGLPELPHASDRMAEYRIVSPGYYQVFQDQLVRGRLLDATLDTPTSQPVVIVNEAFVKKFLPAGTDPIGKQLDDDQKSTIVGVVRNIRQNIYQPPLPEMDYAISQIPGNETGRVVGRMRLIVRTASDPKSIIPALRRAFHDTDVTLPFRTPQTMTEVVADTLIFERLQTWLFGGFAAVAVLLAIVGLYGLIGHEVELSTRDIGVRMALGATRQQILKGIYRRVGKLVTLGLAIGIVVTFAVKQYFESVVPIHISKDAAYLIALCLILALLGLSAALLPAIHAAKTEPVQALRNE